MVNLTTQLVPGSPLSTFPIWNHRELPTHPRSLFYKGTNSISAGSAIPFCPYALSYFSVQYPLTGHGNYLYQSSF